MTHVAILDGQIYTGDNLETGALLVEGACIKAVGPAQALSLPPDAEVIDASGGIVAPGYMDIHVHGGAGADTMDATADALAAMGAFFAAHGVTSFLPTTVTADRGATLEAIEAVANYQASRPQGARALGIHLEGPYVSEQKMGAQNPAFVRGPNAEEYAAFFAHGNVRLISVAPELAGMERFIRWAVAQGAKIAIGHSMATYEEVLQAVEWGVSQATHTYNAMQGMHHRAPGTAGAVLTCDAIYAQIIADLVHVHPAMINLLLRAKGIDRTVLITDAMRAAGLPDGEYDLGGQTVTVAEGQARLASGNLAGSTLTMDRAVRNVVQHLDLSIPDALHMATVTPAMALGVDDHKGRLQPGYDADLVLLDQQLCVQWTMVQGRFVYEA
jgi:N-acetylglucosamine-6-phosphate deacetylase